jgi:hypothetical protein
MELKEPFVHPVDLNAGGATAVFSVSHQAFESDERARGAKSLVEPIVRLDIFGKRFPKEVWSQDHIVSGA